MTNETVTFAAPLPATRPDPRRMARSAPCPSWCEGVHHTRPTAILHRGVLSTLDVRESIEFAGETPLSVCLVQWDVSEPNGRLMRYPIGVELRDVDGSTLGGWFTPRKLQEFSEAMGLAASVMAAEHTGTAPELAPVADTARADGNEEILQLWTAAMRGRGLSERTVGDRLPLIHRVSRDVGAPAVALTSEQIDGWLAKQSHLSLGARSTYFAGIRAFYSWLVRAGHRQDDPTARLDAPRQPKGRPRPVTTAQVERLMNSGIRHRTRVMVLLAAFAGLRAFEIAKIRGEDVDLEADVIRVVGKGEVAAEVPLHPTIKAAAESMPTGGYWFSSYEKPGTHLSPKSVSSVIGRAMHRAGIPGTAHQLRHWYATELVNSGADLRTVQTLMRHSNLNTTARYTAIDRKRMERAVVALPTLR